MNDAFGSARQKELMDAYYEMEKVLPHLRKREIQRSGTDVVPYHIGIWQLYGDQPRYTGESRNKDPTVQATVDHFHALVRQHIIPLVSDLMV